MQRKVIVTGGAGFIGSAVCRRLVAEGASVLNLDALTYAGNLQSLAMIDNAPNYRFAKVDICDRRAVAEAFETFAPDQVIHLAAESHVDRSITAGDAFIQTNIVGTFSMLEAARAYWQALPPQRAGRFPLSARVDRRGLRLARRRRPVRRRRRPTIRARPIRPPRRPPTIWSRAWARTYGLPAVISNCSNNYGPYHFPEKLIPLIILNALHGKPLPVYGAGSQRARLALCRRSCAGPRCDREPRADRREIQCRRPQRTAQHRRGASHLHDPGRASADGAPARRRSFPIVTDRPGHDLRYAIDATKLERELGWRAQETFESGIEKTVRWYLDNEWWWRPLRDKVYAGERLGVIAEAGTMA